MTELHIYGQALWHDGAHIVGERESLRNLRDAITKAIERGQSNVEAEANDGEGYLIHIWCRTEIEMYKMALPYTDEIASDKDKNAIQPWNL